MSVSYVIASIGRPSLAAMLASIETRPGDEILLVGDRLTCDDTRVTHIQCAPGGDYGHAERNYATPMARGRYICHADDDDVYAPGARALMQDAIEKTPGRPVLFRMQAPNGVFVWQRPVIECGQVGTGCFLLPNRPTMLGVWGPFYGGDCHFLQTCKWKIEDYVWREEVTYLTGHNWE